MFSISKFFQASVDVLDHSPTHQQNQGGAKSSQHFWVDVHAGRFQCFAQVKAEPIKPGKTGVIAVKYDTKRVGNFTKEITITTNVQTEPIKLT